jgi:23S rRNA (cytidine1920-2'-O)/16S rRNA (cytidine1409-2'-O)-methyltransferase
MGKQRLDSLLVLRGLAENKIKARAVIMAGEVTAGGKRVDKPGSMVDSDISIQVARKPLYVSRGGIKLAHALDVFKIEVVAATVLDLGASTGGFTDCLLQRGARRVYAIDVGYGQLDYKLRQDPRVAVMEKTNVHHPFELPEKAELAVMDLSFISVTKVIPNVTQHLKLPGNIIVLLKPQFEAEKDEVGRGGIIRDTDIHARVLGRFIAWVVNQGFRLGGLTTSPIYGAEGNREFLVLLNINH